LNWPEKHRPRIGRPNRREHRLVTVLCDGNELGFAPDAFCRSGGHASVAIGRQRTDRRQMAASQDLDGDAKRALSLPTPQDETKPDEQALTTSAPMSVSSALAARSNGRHQHG
jgi:hypothetical protein